ncbi:MAG: hypothetical protein KDD02_05690 [Phaeodactylibacter sp.]|nr:hypothetical protein [Phaeodactylibacter sp.]MCB9299938.1 hypothetical protein [Lewinellaceae bacterium]
MKLLRSLPADKGFFDIYALLIKVIRKSKTAAQIVSGLTEIGIIYAIAYQSIQPILPQYAFYIAGIVAVIFTIVIEGGLRVVTPLSVDAILFKRYQGLHLPMTVAIFLVTIVLLIASGLLSFQNSGEIVEAVTPQAEKQNTNSIDSTYQAEIGRLQATFSTDSAMVASRYNNLITTTNEAYRGKVEATRRKLQTYINREARTGSSYASRKDREQENIAQLEAGRGEAIAALETAKNEELAALHNGFKEQLQQAHRKHETAATGVMSANNEAEIERQDKVSSYGGKLGYFTLVCLFIFIAANVLDRIHHKGSGIRETVDVSQYDISPHWLTNAREAFRERLNHLLQSRIKAFADATPPAPLPEQKAELYDPTQIANVTITLMIDSNGGQEGNIIYLQPKRRKIGFKQPTQDHGKTATTPDTESVQAQQNKCAIKDTAKEPYESEDLRHLKQRLKMYKKRLGSHEQKKLSAERKGEKVSRKTLNAIENNRQWVQHYTGLISQLTSNI